jgi:hypothetical protein
MHRDGKTARMIFAGGHPGPLEAPARKPLGDTVRATSNAPQARETQAKIQTKKARQKAGLLF